MCTEKRLMTKVAGGIIIHVMFVYLLSVPTYDHDDSHITYNVTNKTGSVSVTYINTIKNYNSNIFYD